ncbi:MAG: hypothetical protein M1476_02930 [Candidatus Thermoplasmatota archaeon]|nr:hypothetical protein [Candidatus Thermoplasmatota archaeon]
MVIITVAFMVMGGFTVLSDINANGILNHNNSSFTPSPGNSRTLQSSSVSSTDIQYPVTFNESGLPHINSWYIVLFYSNGTQIYKSQTVYSAGENISFQLPNGSYSYAAHISESPYYYEGNFSIIGSNVDILVNLSKSPDGKSMYETKFSVKGIANSTNWGLYLKGYWQFNQDSSEVNMLLVNGTYSYVASNTENAYKQDGNFTINGMNVSITLNFSNYSENSLPVTFTESGLTQGTVWWINDSQAYPVTGKYFYQTTGSNISFDLPNGTYTFLAVPSPSYIGFSFTFTVDGSENISIPFSSGSANAYQVSFVETGLPTGTTWYANITGYPSSGPMTSSSYAIVLPNGTYSYSVSPVSGYTVKQNGTFSVGGTEVNISVDYVKNTTLNLNFTPAGSAVYVNANSVLLSSSGSASLSLVPGNYYVNASLSGYRSFSDFYTLVSGKTYFVNVTLASLSIYGYLNGTVMPGNATVSAGGLVIPVHSGKFNESIAPGTYYVSFTANGYNSVVKEINITAGKTSTLDVSMTPVTDSVTLSGYITPDNASLVVNGLVAYVNSTGYYGISVPAGTYTISVYESGYFPYSENVTLTSSTMMNFTLVKEPKATSTTSANDTTATGYNVTVSNLTTGNGLVSVSFNSSANGTLIVQIPYTDMKNATISEILNSTVYINGVPYRNYSISISSNYTIILKVYGLKSGDPTLYWKYSPSAIISKPAPAPTVAPPLPLAGYEIMGAITAVSIVAVASIAVFGRRKR